MREVYLAAILHPGDKLEWLYTFERQEDANQCMIDYCRAKGYSADSGHVRQGYTQVVREYYDPAEHNFGLMIKRGIGGDWSESTSANPRRRDEDEPQVESHRLAEYSPIVDSEA